MVNQWMQQLSLHKKFELGNPQLLKLAQNHFKAFRVSDEEILNTIFKCHNGNGYSKMTVDPHTAVGVCSLTKYNRPAPTVCLATGIFFMIFSPSC